MRKIGNKNRIARQAYETLEHRRLLAGDIRLFAGEHVFIRGDHQANQLEIRVVEDGDIQIQGLNGTTINGRDEAIVIENADGRLNSDVRINMGGGDDLVRVEGLDVNGNVRVAGGRGDDAVGLYDSSVQDLFVRTGWGDDSISVDSSMIYGNLAASTFSGDDVVGIDESTIDGSTFLFTGSGDDDVAVRNSTHSGPVLATTGGGNDFVGTDGLNAGGFFALNTGFGTDDVYVNDSGFDGRTFVNGGFQSDNLEVDGNTTFRLSPFVSSFEGNDVAGGQLQIEDVYTDLIISGARLGTINELAALTPQLSTLVGALSATGLDAALEAPGPFTVFAPLNSAFELLPPGTLDNLTIDQLSDILLFHVAADEIFAGELIELTEVDTLLGQPFSVELNEEGLLLNGNVTVNQTDIRAKNGVIHLLNEVLLPV